MIKKMLAASVFAVFVTAVPVVSDTALASSDNTYFYPKSKWIVERIGDINDPAKPQVCTVSNQLNNGYIVQIAGDNNGFTNLNIDFRQDSFELNRKYEVKFSVPGILEELIPTKAFKENLLVSDLRSKSAFSEALQSASVLDVKIRDNAFRIYMTGIGAAMKQYAKCVNPDEISVSLNKQGQSNTGGLSDTESLDNISLNSKDSSHLINLTIHDSTQQPTDDIIKKADISDSTTGAKEKLAAEIFSAVEPVAGNTSEDIDNVSATLLNNKIDELEKQIEILLSKNKMLNEELKSVLLDAENEKISVSSDNWNLERATMKFNEAERQILRLGRKLQAQEIQCKNEKAILENMLFDPKLTSQHQLATLASLETELDRTKAELNRQKRRYEERIRLLEERLGSQY